MKPKSVRLTLQGLCLQIKYPWTNIWPDKDLLICLLIRLLLMHTRLRAEALWAGLPVVTKVGLGFAARVAGSLLNAVGLPELITETEKDYEALILELATNPTKLARLKRS